MFFQINNGIFPFLMLGLVGMFGLFSGRIFCGWVCPTGFISDLFSGLAGSNKRLSIKADKTMKKFKLLLLIVMFLLFLPLGFYEVYDPNNYANYSAALGNLLSNPVGPFSLSEFLFVSIPNLVKAGMNGLNFASFFNDNAGTITLFIIYCIIIAIIVYYPRFYCKYICPYAALVGIFSEYSFYDCRDYQPDVPEEKIVENVKQSVLCKFGSWMNLMKGLQGVGNVFSVWIVCKACRRCNKMEIWTLILPIFNDHNFFFNFNLFLIKLD